MDSKSATSRGNKRKRNRNKKNGQKPEPDDAQQAQPTNDHSNGLLNMDAAPFTKPAKQIEVDDVATKPK